MLSRAPATALPCQPGTLLAFPDPFAPLKGQPGQFFDDAGKRGRHPAPPVDRNDIVLWRSGARFSSLAYPPVKQSSLAEFPGDNTRSRALARKPGRQ